jgi:hypothetical protein
MRRFCFDDFTVRTVLIAEGMLQTIQPALIIEEKQTATSKPYANARRADKK